MECRFYGGPKDGEVATIASVDEVLHFPKSALEPLTMAEYRLNDTGFDAHKFVYAWAGWKNTT
jgi:hypothetical protein